MTRRLAIAALVWLCASPCLAALDSKAKRGSAIGLGTPRLWLAEPAGSMDVSSRLSLLTLFAGDAGEPDPDPDPDPDDPIILILQD